MALTDTSIAQNQNPVTQPSFSLVPCAISDRYSCDTLTVTVYSDLLKVKVNRVRLPGDAQRSAAMAQRPRGKVTDFSKKSRLRALATFAKKTVYARPLFLTLTYPDEVYFDRQLSPRDVQRHYEAFRKRLMRQFPGVGGFMRKEFETRKSGRFSGHVAPHFHVVIDGLLHDMAYLRKLFRRCWTEILEAEDLPKRPRIDLSVARSKRHLYYYVSKYTAKTRDSMKDTDPVTGELKIRSWLINHAGEVGRHWAVFGKWDMTPFMVVHLSIEELTHIRRLAAGWAKSRNRRFSRWLKRWHRDLGFMVFGLGATSCKLWGSFWDSTAVRMLPLSGFT